MKAFARLLDSLAFEPSRNAREALLVDYFRSTSDPDRGYALAVITGTLDFRTAKPALLKALISERTDPVLFGLSYDFVGDLSETIALMWPASDAVDVGPLPLSAVVEALTRAGKSDAPRLIAAWLDALGETERWALLKLVTGGLRVGVSARLAKTALSRLSETVTVEEIDDVWNALKPPYASLFAWLEGHAPKPDIRDPAPFRPPMLAHPLDEEKDLASLDPSEFAAEWKWDGIRVQAAAGVDGEVRHQRLYSRSGEDITTAFPDLVEELRFDGAIDGELLVIREGEVQPFSELQRRLNRKTADSKLMQTLPVGIRAYDLLSQNGEDLRAFGFLHRRARLETLVRGMQSPRIDLSPLILFHSWQDLAAARGEPSSILSPADAAAVEGVMLKRMRAPYVSGRPKGEWFKWKRDPFLIDAVLMYAQRGHGKRSSYYSDYTFGVWRGQELVPVGKAYFGFTDEELLQIDRFVRNNTVGRFGPVREVMRQPDKGLVLEVAFDGLNRSSRHKSGLAMRFPRISRLRWDKTPAEADHIESLEVLLSATRV